MKLSTRAAIEGTNRKLTSIIRKLPHNAMTSVVAVVVFGGIGAALLMNSHAATPTADFEAENGTITSCATSVSDSGASGGHALQFGTCSSSSSDTGTPTNLDASGNTIPDTNYAIPAGAIFISTTGNDNNAGTQNEPVKTLNKAVSLAGASGTVVVRGGSDASPAVYRDWYHSYNANIAANTFGVISNKVTIQAYPHEKAWFDGTDIESTGNWTSDGAGHWYMSWNTPSFCGTLPTATTSNYYSTSLASQNIGATGNTQQGPCTWTDGSLDSANPMAGDPQMVFVDGVYKHEATSLSSATGGAFYYDWTNKRVYISTNPSGHTIELAARPMFSQLNGAGSEVLGLGFKRYASHIYSNNNGVIYGGASGQTYENDVFTQNAGPALQISHAANTVIDHSVMAFNGGDGLGALGSVASGGTDNFVVKNNIFNNNNSELFWTNCHYSCAAANMKLDKMAGYNVQNNIIENGQGAALGTWCDEACTNGKTISNIVSGNGNAGILYEVSDTGIVASNLVYNNGNNGIRIGSAHTKVYNNTVVNNSGSDQIWVYDDPRGPDNKDSGNTGATQVGPDTVGTYLANNIISGAIEAVRVQGTQTDHTNTVPSQFFSLFDYNSYYRSAGSGQTLIDWIPPTNRTYYVSLTNIRNDLGFEAHGQDFISGGDPFFVNQAGGNYTVRSSSAAYHSATTIPDDVAAAIGITQKTGQSRGALVWPGQ